MAKLPIPQTLAELLTLSGQSPTFSQQLKDMINDDLASKRKQLMFEGIKYFDGNHDITGKRRYYWDKNRQRQVDETKDNNRIVNNFHADFVDEKVFYILGKQPKFSGSNELFETSLDQAVDLRFYEVLQRAVEGASNKGHEFIYVFINRSEDFDYTIMPAEELIIVRDQSIEDTITDIIRYYKTELVSTREKTSLYRVEWYKPEGVTYYIENSDGEFILDEDEPVNPKPYLLKLKTVDNISSIVEQKNWGEPAELPFIEICNNRSRRTDLERIKTLQDAYNAIESGFFDNISDIQEIVKVIRGALGSEPHEVQENLRFYKLALFDEDGGIDVVKVDIPTEARERALARLYKDIHHLGKAVLVDQEKIASGATGVALKFMYSRLDMKANDAILGLKIGLEKFARLFAIYDLFANGRKHADIFIEWAFEKSQIFNELERIQAAQASKGIISDETIIKNHPWVTDHVAEMERMDEQASEQINLDVEPEPELITNGKVE